ncbi:helix-turn-helix transcriptional regulator [Microbacterium proteolyticum]|nr:helix-turn-helix transcriptional regulator [Microbacterium proteolyticum]
MEFRLAPDDVSAIRFGVSPGHELCQAVRVLAAPQAHPLQWGWLRVARGLVPSASFDLLRLVIGDDGYLPDFLTSTPRWDLTPEQEHQRLTEADLRPMVVDLGKRADRVTGSQREALLTLRDDPERTRALVSDAWRELWEAVLAPHWPGIQQILSADIGARSRRTSSDGIGAMVDAIDDAISWKPDAVVVELARHDEVLDCRGSGLVLVPSVMSRRCAALTEPPAQPTLFYPALGVTESWTSSAADTASSVIALLGEGRARILLSLHAPLSTSGAAAVAGLAVSTASHHLSVLRAAHLVSSRREGSSVVHDRTPLGEALVNPGS